MRNTVKMNPKSILKRKVQFFFVQFLQTNVGLTLCSKTQLSYSMVWTSGEWERESTSLSMSLPKAYSFPLRPNRDGTRLRQPCCCRHCSGLSLQQHGANFPRHCGHVSHQHTVDWLFNKQCSNFIHFITISDEDHRQCQHTHAYWGYLTHWEWN